MKRYLVILVLTIISIGVKAQVTWNVRAGVGVGCDHHNETGFEPAFIAQCNIPFKKAGQAIFSPSLMFEYVMDRAPKFSLPLQFGYKVAIGQNALFVPKIGGIIGTDCDAMIAGPSVDLAFEIKHFVVGVDGYYDVSDEGIYGALCTFGYKF